MTTRISEMPLVAMGYEQLDVSSAAALTIPAAAKYAVIQALDRDVRWRDDETDPTASVGMVLQAGKERWFFSKLSQLRFIQTAATAEVNVSYYADPGTPVP